MLLLPLLLGGCGTAPLVLDAGGSGPSVLSSIPDAQLIDTRSADGTLVRGVFVEAGSEAGERALVILHLLPSGASVQTGISAGIGRVDLGTTTPELLECERGFLDGIRDAAH